ncbi:MAG: hypothetical protein AMJ45_03875 [Syntrophobacter sp. DG_60]|nr:MAG: hypothetical protein AMJ45_03875 [Syntrophobacter sp. DG_60]
METLTKVADTKGRITLGSEYAKRTFLIEKKEDGIIILKPAEVVPVDEAWLWKNKAAFNKVIEGIEDAQMNKFAEVDLKDYED